MEWIKMRRNFVEKERVVPLPFKVLVRWLWKIWKSRAIVETLEATIFSDLETGQD